MACWWRPGGAGGGWWLGFLVAMAMCQAAAGQDGYAVHGFKLHGIRQISGKALREALATKARPWSHRFFFWKESPLFDEEEFERDLLRIVKFYRLEGFLEARVDSHRVRANDRKRRVTLDVYVSEGRPLLVEQVDLRVVDGTIPDEKPWRELPGRLAIQREKRWREASVKADVDRIATTLASASFPYARVKSSAEIDSSIFTANVQYSITPGPFCTFGNIQITGLQAVPRKVVLRELNVSPGERYNQSRLMEGQQLVYRLELFQFVSVRATDFENQATTIPVEVKVKEAVHNTLKVGLGYGTEDQFRASVDWRRRNFLGGGRRLESKMKHSGLEPARVEMNLIQPHFFGRRNIAVFKPFFLREDEINFNINRLGANISVQRHFATYTDGYINYRFETDRIDAPGQLGDEDKSLAENLKRNKSIGTFGMVRNNSRPLFNPTQGGINSMTLEYSGRAFDSKFPYWKFTVERRGFVELGPRWVFAYRLKVGSMAPVAGREVTPIEERFYCGGSTSVRGWRRFELGPLSEADRTPLGGNSLFEGSTELRYPIYRFLSGSLFVDFGNVWRPANTIVLNELRYAAGLGLRFATPIGPIRFDLGRKINKQYAAESTFEFHLSVGQAF